jgi:hypothetical protein
MKIRISPLFVFATYQYLTCQLFAFPPSTLILYLHVLASFICFAEEHCPEISGALLTFLVFVVFGN